MKDFRWMELFRKAYNIYEKLLNDVAKEHNLTSNQLKILMFLERNNGNNIAKNIVEGLGATKSHVSMSVSDLEKNGYIQKSQDESNKKKTHLELTNKSLQIIKDGKEVQKKIKEMMFEGINEDELKILNDVSNKIHENLEKIQY